MPRLYNQKTKLLALQDMLMEQTDEEHGLTVPEMIAQLEAQGIHAERKSVYSDLNTLLAYGMDIVQRKEGNKMLYYVGSRAFEMPELKLLVDAVQASRFITRRKSSQLIEKVAGFASSWQAKQLQRQVYVANRIKAENESIYYNVDRLYAAIAANRQITFRYRVWAFQDGGSGALEKQYRRHGKTYQISPWALCWSGDNYYMIGFDGDAALIKHYRVDKMDGITVTQTPRAGQEHFENFDMAVYTRRIFGMFGGEEETVLLEAENSLLDAVLDRFGEETAIRREGETFVARVHVAVSPQFLSWVFGFEGRMRIRGPEAVVQTMREQARRVLEKHTDPA